MANTNTMQQATHLQPCRGSDRYAVTMAKVVEPGVMADFSSVDGVIAFLRSRGSRVTSSRRILLEVLFAADDHMSAETLAEAVQVRAPDVHLSTIYRNLEELEHLGVI